MATTAEQWAYYISYDSAGDGAPMEIVRRSFNADGIPGPFIESLSPPPTSEWVATPQALASFRDPGWFKPVSEAEARSAAEGCGGVWPSEE